MDDELQKIIKRLNEAKEQRGRLTRIASDSGISYRTIYAVMTGAKPSLGTVEKLTAHFKKVDKKLAKDGA
jgi:DNA-binding phage protein